MSVEFVPVMESRIPIVIANFTITTALETVVVMMESTNVVYVMDQESVMT